MSPFGPFPFHAGAAAFQGFIYLEAAMAASNFATCLGKVLKHEGGYVNHPKDPGGATNKGVIQRTYDTWRKSMGLAPRSV